MSFLLCNKDHFYQPGARSTNGQPCQAATWVPTAGVLPPGPDVGLNVVIRRADTVSDGGVDGEVDLPQVLGLLSCGVVHSPTWNITQGGWLRELD